MRYFSESIQQYRSLLKVKLTIHFVVTLQLLGTLYFITSIKYIRKH